MKSNKIIKAIEFMYKAHGVGKRRGSNLPYTIHTITVSELYKLYYTEYTELEIIACLLHDTIEDTYVTYEDIKKSFGEFVADLVSSLTNEEKEMSRLGNKNEYLKAKMIEMNNVSLAIKMCDRLHNISDRPSDKYLVNTIELINFIKDNRTLTHETFVLAIHIIELCERKLNENQGE